MIFRLQKIDELTLADHYHLTESDICLYFGEYTARKGFAFSDTNKLITNLKKSVLKKTKYEYRFKQHAINTIAEVLSKFSNPHEFTFVPVPPSICKADPEYDDRLIQILTKCQQINPAFDFRELITQKESISASHSSLNRPPPETLAKNYEYQHALASDIRSNLIIFDDVLTAGSHYKAMKTVLKQHLAEINIIGLFIARTVRHHDDVVNDF